MPPTMSSACLLSVENFTQRISLIREVGNAETKENSQRRLNNNNAVITLGKADCRRIDASELWCWRRLLRVPWTARRSNQSILKEISPGCSLEGLMLKLKLQSFGHLMQRADTLEKTLMLGKIEGGRRRG